MNKLWNLIIKIKRWIFGQCEVCGVRLEFGLSGISLTCSDCMFDEIIESLEEAKQRIRV